MKGFLSKQCTYQNSVLLGIGLGILGLCYARHSIQNSILRLNESASPFICKFYNQTGYPMTVTGGTSFPGQNLSPPIGTVIADGSHYDYCIFTDLQMTLSTSSGKLIGASTVLIKTDSSGNNYLLDESGLLVFNYDAAHSEYPSSDPWQQRHAMDIVAPSVSQGPPVITNAWTSGMGNSLTKPTAKNSFWVTDYGINENGRWTIVDSDAVAQGTQLINNNVGSRAYPVYLATGAPTWTIYNATPYAPGTGFTGCWQIEMKCGSRGTGDFVETFYLAERANLSPGPNHYQDGSGAAPGGNSREIDLMETKWKPEGPQANCPNGGDTGWNSEWSNQQMGNWSDVGGLPMTDYVTFGCLIRDNKLWIYGYRPDGKLWYCSDAILNTNTSYKQEYPFVPYIGTWSTGHTPGDFQTCYRNFIYLEDYDPKITGKNPKDNPEAFGPVLL